jgi:hypothetical protein
MRWITRAVLQPTSAAGALPGPLWCGSAEAHRSGQSARCHPALAAQLTCTRNRRSGHSRRGTADTLRYDPPPCCRHARSRAPSLCCRMAFAGNPLAGPRGGRPRGLRWRAEASCRSALPLTRRPTRRAAVPAARGTGQPAARRAPPSWGGGRSRGPCVAGVSRGLRDRLVAVRPVMTGAWPHALTPTAP